MRVWSGWYFYVLGIALGVGVIGLILGPFLGWGPGFAPGGIGDIILFGLSELGFWAILLLFAGFGAAMLVTAYNRVRERLHLVLRAVDGQAMMMAIGGLLVVWLAVAGMIWNIRGEL